MDEITSALCKKLDLQVVETLKAGNICDAVYRVITRERALKVLKVGNTPRTMVEIHNNLIGYDKIRQLGLPYFIPNIYSSGEFEFFAYILMEDCGLDFVARTKTEANPTGLYLQLVTAMKNIYHRTVHPSQCAKESVLRVAKKAQSQYMAYLSHLDPAGMVLDSLDRMVEWVQHLHVPLATFSSWDFTPEDVYLTKEGVKYADPHEDVVGIPIIDLACFGGVVRDAYALSGSIEGYQLLHTLALEHLDSLLEISREDAEKLFNMGRVLQCFLSARFRCESDPIKAKQLFLQGGEILAQIAG